MGQETEASSSGGKKGLLTNSKRLKNLNNDLQGYEMKTELDKFLLLGMMNRKVEVKKKR